MADDLKNPGPEDGKLISLVERHERAYWMETLGVNRDRLEEVVEAVGHSAAAVRAYLEGPRGDDHPTDYPQDVIDNPPCETDDEPSQ